MIDERAVIHPKAQLGQNVSLGPFAYIGEGVVIGDDCVIESHVVIKGPTIIGRGNHFYQFGSIGEACQDKKYQGESTQLIIGDYNIFRESVTVHRGTIQDKAKTVIGDHNLLMAYVHIAHDCVLGNHVVMCTSASIAGHCMIDDWAILSGFVGVHQNIRVGAHAFAAGAALVLQDIPPFVMASGHSAKPKGLNTEGLKRRGFSSEEILALRTAYKIYYRSGLIKSEALKKIRDELYESEAVLHFASAIENSERGVVR